jgi:hypothetical protein
LTSVITGVVIFALTLIIWAFFYIMTPGEPLAFNDTLIVLGACAAAVFILKWMGKWLWGRLTRDDRDS